MRKLKFFLGNNAFHTQEVTGSNPVLPTMVAESVSQDMEQYVVERLTLENLFPATNLDYLLRGLGPQSSRSGVRPMPLGTGTCGKDIHDTSNEK